MQSRNWCFTINNYTLEDILSLDENEINYSYCIYGLEVGKNGTPHIQGYVEFNSVKRFETLKKLLPKAHLETRKSTQEKAINYCKKDDEWCEYGNKKCQGQRNDLDKVRALALEDGMRAVTRTANLQQIKVAKEFLTYNEEPRDWKPEVIWLYGETGAGKSKLARELTGPDDVYTKNDGTKWWDRYDGHENVIIDDFRDSWWSLTEMLSLLDRYEKQVEIKGGWRQFKPKKIIITSAKAPLECYRGTGEDQQQLIRRLDQVTKCVKSPASEVGEGNTIASPPKISDEEIKKILLEFNL